jgi:hypothetical protein
MIHTAQLQHAEHGAGEVARRPVEDAILALSAAVRRNDIAGFDRSSGR